MNREISCNDGDDDGVRKGEEINERTSYFSSGVFLSFSFLCGKKKFRHRKRKRGNCSALIPGEFFVFSSPAHEKGKGEKEIKDGKARLRESPNTWQHIEIVLYLVSNLYNVPGFLLLK